MPGKSNIAGVRFGHLVAVEQTPERKNGYTVWKCLCDCGRTIGVPSRYLKNGWTTACGDSACEYTRTDQKMRSRHMDLTGRRFGKLVVQSKAKERDKAGRVLWNCVCDCGNTFVAPAGQLNAGYRRSCGCLSRQPLKDWVGKQFGSLTVIAYDGKRSGKHFWKCRCTCGNEVTVCQSNLKIGHTISCGCQNTPYNYIHFVDGTCVEAIRGAIRTGTIARNNSSGVRGVYKNKRTGRWCAQITFQGHTRYLGSYDTLQEAAKARQKGEEIFEDFLTAYEKREYDGETEEQNVQTDRPQEDRKEQTDQSQAAALQTSSPPTTKVIAFTGMNAMKNLEKTSQKIMGTSF